MSSFRARVAEDRRLRILQILDQAEGYDCNEHVLRAELERFAHRPSLDVLRSELSWLEEQGLISTHSAGSMIVAGATARGLDCAGGRARIPGVSRPDPQ